MNFPVPKQLAELLEKDVYELCRPEGRMVGTEGHRVAEDFVRRRLTESGCNPYRKESFDLPYTGEGYLPDESRAEIQFTNFAGTIPGKNRSLAPVLVGAHYDSVIDAPCADDNGAAVAICLAIANAAKQNGGLDRDLVITIFDAEEPPHFMMPTMGSTRFYHDQVDDRGIHFALIFDLVGHDVSIPAEYLPMLGRLTGMQGIDLAVPGLKNFLFMTGAESQPDLARITDKAGISRKLTLLPTLNRYVGDMSDHGVFRQNDVPYLFLSCGRWRHYHRVTDTPDRLNYLKMARIAEFSGNVLECAASEPLTTVSTIEDHSLDFELTKLKSAFGFSLPFILKSMGISKLESREDLDRFVQALMSLGI